MQGKGAAGKENVVAMRNLGTAPLLVVVMLEVMRGDFGYFLCTVRACIWGVGFLNGFQGWIERLPRRSVRRVDS